MRSIKGIYCFVWRLQEHAGVGHGGAGCEWARYGLEHFRGALPQQRATLAMQPRPCYAAFEDITTMSRRCAMGPIQILRLMTSVLGC